MKKTQIPLEVLWTIVLGNKKVSIFFPMNDVGKLDRGQIDGLPVEEHRHETKGST